MSREPPPELVDHVLGRAQPDDEPASAMVLADAARECGDLRLTAAALDRAWGLAPHDVGIARLRAQALNEVQLEEHGVVFRYVPAGSFLMGSLFGDLDEQPVHSVRTQGFWVSEGPISWASYAELMGWDPPPRGAPPGQAGVFSENRIRLQYCETTTLGAVDWHAHAGMVGMGTVTRGPGPQDYDQKPMVAVSWTAAEELGARLSTQSVQYGLPTEAEWEKAARGGLIGKRYSWGDEPPDQARCDFGHFGTFVIRSPREFPPNGYGLYSMCGGVWEWTADAYDSLAYHPRRPPDDPGPERPRVVRGGSFSDDEEAVTVSFRSAMTSHFSPNIGFRLVRREGDFPLRPGVPSTNTVSLAPGVELPKAKKESWFARWFGKK